MPNPWEEFQPQEESPPWEAFASAPPQPEEAGPWSEFQAPVEEEPVGESPGILKSAAQGVLDMGGQVARAGTFLAGGGIENVGEMFGNEDLQQVGQSLQDTGKGWQKSIGETILTPEERRGQDVVDKVAGGVAGFLPLLALGPVAGTVLGAGTAGVGTAADALDAGETMAAATTAGAIQGASVLAMLRLPGFAKTIPGTLGVVAATGPVAGAAADYLTAGVMDTEEGQSPYVMYDKEGKINKDYFANRVTETLTGGVFGAYGRYKWQNLPETRLAQDIARLNGAEADAYYSKLTDRVDKILETNSWTTYHQPNETWERTRERFFKETDSFHDWWIKKDLMDTDRVKNIPQALEIFFHTAPDAETKAYAAYLLERSSIEGLNWANVMTLTKGHPDSPRGGQYQRSQDMVRLEEGLQNTLQVDPSGAVSSKPDWDAFTKVALHEIGHARTTARVHELANRDPALNTQFNEVFQTMRERIGKEFITADIDKNLETRWRGLKNADEFFAELPLGNNYFVSDPLTTNHRGVLNRSLKSDLAKIELTESEIRDLFPKETKATKKTGYLPANTQRFYQMMGANKQPKTMLDVATAWYEVLMRDMDLTRAQRFKVWANTPNMGYELKGPVSEAIRHKQDAQQDILNDMNTPGTEDRRFWQVLWTNLRNSDSAQEFGIRMANIDPANKRLAAWAESNAQKIYDKKDWYAEILKGEAGIVPMGPSSNRALESRDVAQFIEDEKPQGGGDIKLNSLQRAFLNPLTIRLMVGQQGFAGRAVKYMIDMGLRYSHEADKVYHQFKTEDAKEYYKLSKKEQANVMNMASHFDSFQGRQTLQRAGVMWPDDTMMRTAFPKITDAEIAGYKGLARGVDNLFHVLDMLSRKTTGQGIPRIPGFMPHYHAGPYKVFFSKPMAGANGTSVDKTVLVRGFSTRKQAQLFANHMVQHAGLDIVPDPRTGGDIRVFQWDDVGQSMLGNYKDHVDAFLNMQEVFRNPEREAEMKTIQKAEDTVNAEWSKHMQERSGVKGYIGEFGMSANPWDSKWTNFKLKTFGESETLRIYDKYAREVAETYRNVMFLEDVYAPLMGLDTSPMGKERHGQALMKYESAFKYMEKFGKNFLGKNLNHLSWVDNSIRTGLIKMGWDPMLVKNFVRTTRNMLGATKLRVNPANWIANYIQKVHTIAQLQYMEVVSGGDPSGAVQSFIRVAKKTPEELGAAYVRAKEWAESQHIVDPLLDMEVKGESKGLFANTPLLGGIQHAWNKTGEVNAIVERHGRTQSFLTAFDFYMNKGMDEGAAREAARLVMGMTMVNYDRASRPLMYQDLGMVGEAMAPFAVFRNAFLGNMYMMTKTLLTSQNKMTAAKPFMTTMLTFMALAGAAGIPLMGEYDMLVNFINYMYPGQMDLPTGEVLMMKADVPEILMYGVPSQMFKLLGFANGINFSPSMGAVNVDDAGSFAILPYWKAMGQVLKLGVQVPLSATGAVEPPSVTDFYDPAKKLTPNVLHPMIEAFISGGDFSRGLKSTSAEGLTKRDPADIISLMISGKHSTKERRERSAEREVDRKEEELKGNLRHLIKLRADFLEGIPVMMDVEDIDRRAMEIYKITGQDPSGYNKRVFQEVMKRKLDKQTKRHLSSSPSKYWKERMRQQLLGNGPSVDVPTPEMEEE